MVQTCGSTSGVIPFSAPELAILALGVFRLTRLVTVDDFPPVQRARDALLRRFGKDGVIGSLVTCPWCAGVWLSGLVVASAALWQPALWLWLVLAVSGAVGLLSGVDDD